MVELFMAMLSVAAAFWMYFDATKHAIGKDPNKPSLWRLSAGGWATWGIMCWPLGLPIYLFRRASLIDRAKLTPVMPKNKARSLIFLGIASVALIGFNLSTDSTDAVNAVDRGASASEAPMTDQEIRQCEMTANIIVRSTAPLAQIYGQDYVAQKAREQIQAKLSPACQARLAREWNSQ